MGERPLSPPKTNDGISVNELSPRRQEERETSLTPRGVQRTENGREGDAEFGGDKVCRSTKQRNRTHGKSIVMQSLHIFLLVGYCIVLFSIVYMHAYQFTYIYKYCVELYF